MLLRKFLALHLLFWTLIPTLVNHNLHLDVIESLAWGKEWQLGYEKHPPLTAWITEIFATHEILIYFISQLAVITAIIYVYKLALLLLEQDKEQKAIFAALILEAIYYFNFTTPEFNPNVLQLPLWAGATYYFIQAKYFHKYNGYIIAGIFAAFAILTKYYSLILVAMLFFLLKKEDFQKTQLYIGAILFLAILSPHIYWLIEHNFSTISYAKTRSQSDLALVGHILHPLKFALTQILALSPAIIIFFLCCKRKSIDHNLALYLALFPLMITLTISLITGIKLKSMWGSTIWLFAGIYLAHLAMEINWQRFKKSISTVFCLSLIAYILTPTLSKKISRVEYPGKEIANAIDHHWREYYHNDYQIIAGDIWAAGNIAYYSPQRPSVFIDYSFKKSPWIKRLDHGTVFILENNYSDKKAEFPNLSEEFIYKSSSGIIVQYAFLP